MDYVPASSENVLCISDIQTLNATLLMIALDTFEEIHANHLRMLS